MLKGGKYTITVYIFFKQNEYYEFICLTNLLNLVSKPA